MLPVLSAALMLFSSSAWAGPCDVHAKKADSATGPALTAAYKDLVKCDKSLAEANFVKFMASAKDSDSLVELSLAAIDADIWTPVWTMIGKITDYEARDEVAGNIGLACASHPKVPKFLQGAYFGIRDIEFSQWDDALMTCESPDLLAWMATQMENPPTSSYDEKFSTLAHAYAKRQGAAALPTLAKGALKAAKEGPYDAILTQMDEAVAPSMGEEMSADDRKALEDALIMVAKGVDPDKARAVADKLANSGNEAAAARLLPMAYPDRVKAGGSFLYGAASIEIATCKGEKTAVIHWAPVTEPGKRWVILGDVEAPMRALKPKLEKCTSEGGPWGVATTPEPVGSNDDIETWAQTFGAPWAEKGYALSLKEEKPVVLK